MNSSIIKFEKSVNYLTEQLNIQDNNKQLLLDIITNIEIIKNNNSSSKNLEILIDTANDFLSEITENITTINELKLEISNITKELTDVLSNTDRNSKSKEYYITTFSNIKNNLEQFTEKYQCFQNKLENSNDEFNEFISINNFKYNYNSIDNSDNDSENKYEFTGFSINNEKMNQNSESEDECNDLTLLEFDDINLKENLFENIQDSAEGTIEVTSDDISTEEKIENNFESILDSENDTDDIFEILFNSDEEIIENISDTIIDNDEELIENTSENISDISIDTNEELTEDTSESLLDSENDTDNIFEILFNSDEEIIENISDTSIDTNEELTEDTSENTSDTSIDADEELIESIDNELLYSSLDFEIENETIKTQKTSNSYLDLKKELNNIFSELNGISNEQDEIDLEDIPLEELSDDLNLDDPNLINEIPNDLEIEDVESDKVMPSQDSTLIDNNDLSIENCISDEYLSFKTSTIDNNVETTIEENIVNKNVEEFEVEIPKQPIIDENNVLPEENTESEENIDINIDDTDINELLISDKNERIAETTIETISNFITKENLEQKVEESFSEDINTKIRKIINAEQDNKDLIISERTNCVFLPYTLEDLKMFIESYPENYSSLTNVVEKEYILSFDYFIKHPIKARFEETYNLLKNRNGNSSIYSLNYALKLVKMDNLNPAIIAACKTEKELDTYLYLLSSNSIRKFKYFNVIYDINPL